MLTNDPPNSSQLQQTGPLLTPPQPAYPFKPPDACLYPFDLTERKRCDSLDSNYSVDYFANHLNLNLKQHFPIFEKNLQQQQADLSLLDQRDLHQQQQGHADLSLLDQRDLLQQQQGHADLSLLDQRDLGNLKNQRGGDSLHSTYQQSFPKQRGDYYDLRRNSSDYNNHQSSFQSSSSSSNIKQLSDYNFTNQHHPQHHHSEFSSTAYNLPIVSAASAASNNNNNNSQLLCDSSQTSDYVTSNFGGGFVGGGGGQGGSINNCKTSEYIVSSSTPRVNAFPTVLPPKKRHNYIVYNIMSPQNNNIMARDTVYNTNQMTAVVGRDPLFRSSSSSSSAVASACKDKYTPHHHQKDISCDYTNPPTATSSAYINVVTDFGNTNTTMTAAPSSSSNIMQCSIIPNNTQIVPPRPHHFEFDKMESIKPFPAENKSLLSSSTISAYHHQHQQHHYTMINPPHLQHQQQQPPQKNQLRGPRSVKIACVVCKKQNKKCDSFRPCTRCTRLGVEDGCVDAPRKKKVVGARGPYKKQLVGNKAGVLDDGKDLGCGRISGGWCVSKQ